jgi:hypothetical protein
MILFLVDGKTCVSVRTEWITNSIPAPAWGATASDGYAYTYAELKTHNRGILLRFESVHSNGTRWMFSNRGKHRYPVSIRPTSELPSVPSTDSPVLPLSALPLPAIYRKHPQPQHEIAPAPVHHSPPLRQNVQKETGLFCFYRSLIRSWYRPIH